MLLKKNRNREFSGGLVVRIPGFHCVAWVQALVRELRSHRQLSLVKKKKERKYYNIAMLKKEQKSVVISVNLGSKNIKGYHNLCMYYYYF